MIQGHATVFCADNDIGDFLNGPASTEASPVIRFLNAIAAFTAFLEKRKPDFSQV